MGKEAMKKVLIIVDMQNDFMPGGALPVAKGFDIVPNIVKEAHSGYDLIVATRDYHPQTHMSFKEILDEKDQSRGIWPMHCIRGTRGAQLLDQIDMVADIIISKGTDAEKEAYSGFDTKNQELATIISSLQERGHPPAEVTVVGVATEYCVKATAYGSYARGYPTTVLVDCIAAVDEDDGVDTLLEMAQYDITLRPRE